LGISLIIPAYNEEKLISQTIISVLCAKAYLQQHANVDLEIIVVNNDSTDNTVAILSEFHEVKVVFESEHNIAKVRNTGAKHAKHDILCFLDADSILCKNIFFLIYKSMNSGKFIGGGAKFKLDRKNLTFSLIFIASVFATHIIGLSGVLIYTTKEAFFTLEGFNSRFLAAEDIDFVIRLRNLGRTQGLRFKNIYKSYVITSSRKFKKIKFQDLFFQGGLLLHKSLREDSTKCEQWYNTDKYH